MRWATFTIKDDLFYVYFRDRLKRLAPVDEVLAATRGLVSQWSKYNSGDD